MSDSREIKLPVGFSDLEDLVAEWSLSTERDRKEKRATASMPELAQYYDRLKERIPRIAEYLDQRPYKLDSLPGEDGNLLKLAYMYMEAAMAVEFFRRPEPLASFPRDRFVIEDIRI